MANKKSETPTLTVASKTKEYIKDSSEVRVGGEFLDALNEHVIQTINRAIKRCEGNGRKTLRPEDL